MRAGPAMADRPDHDLAAVEAHRRPDVALDIIRRADRDWSRAHRRPPILTPREALLALEYDANLVAVAAGNVRNGVKLADEDFDSLAAAAARIELICREVRR